MMSLAGGSPMSDVGAGGGVLGPGLEGPVQ